MQVLLKKNTQAFKGARKDRQGQESVLSEDKHLQEKQHFLNKTKSISTAEYEIYKSQHYCELLREALKNEARLHIAAPLLKTKMDTNQFGGRVLSDPDPSYEQSSDDEDQDNDDASATAEQSMSASGDQSVSVISQSSISSSDFMSQRVLQRP